MPQRDSDTFTYSDGNLATVSGGKWAKVTAYADMVVTSGKAQGVAAIETASCIAAWSGSLTDQYAQCTWVAAGHSQFCGPSICNNGSNAFYVYDARAGAAHHIFKVTAGPTYTDLAASPGSISLANGDTLYIERVAGVITCKLNGVVTVSVTDTSLVSGKPGLRAFDNGVLLDSWAAGDFAAPSGGAPGGGQASIGGKSSFGPSSSPSIGGSW